MTQYPLGYGYPQPDMPHGPVPPPSKRRGMPWWGWALIVLVVVSVLTCGGLLSFFVYLGARGPDTKVYMGNEVPARFVQIARDVGVLEPDEKVRFFYSDALTDIKDGFYLAADRKVVVYTQSAQTPATIVPYDKIVNAELISSDTWIEDGTLTLELIDGTFVSFPISSEGGRDKKFHQAILSSIKKPPVKNPATR